MLYKKSYVISSFETKSVFCWPVLLVSRPTEDSPSLTVVPLLSKLCGALRIHPSSRYQTLSSDLTWEKIRTDLTWDVTPWMARAKTAGLRGSPCWTGGWIHIYLVSVIYWYQSKMSMLSGSVGVDKTLLYSSQIQTTCERKHNEASQQLSYSNANRCVLINKQTRLTMKQVSAVAAETKGSLESFAILKAYCLDRATT